MADFRIKHITRYSYASTVIDCTNQIMLFPVNDITQNVKKHELKITNDPTVEKFTDYFGNTVGVFSNIAPHNILLIVSDIVVSTNPVVLPEDNHPAVQQWMELDKLRDQYPFLDFMQHEALTSMAELEQISVSSINKNDTPYTNAKRLSEYIYTNFEYKKGVTSIETKIDDILKLKAGVCQDFAHLLLVLLHISGIPARYVSGYICPKNHELRGEGATHAWVEAYLPYYGWLGLDPTNNCIASDRHVKLAIGKNFSDCTPVKGTYKGSSEHTLEVSVSIENGHLKTQEEKEAVQTFTYTSKNPGINNNSYRQYLEQQQQQQ